MNKKLLAKFKKMLEERRRQIIESVSSTKDEGLGVDVDDLPDEVDQATSETNKTINLRLRDREQILLKKIDKALKKIEEGTYGICEVCGEDIDIKRLEIRPVTDLCIRCKEDQERAEKTFAE